MGRGLVSVAAVVGVALLIAAPARAQPTGTDHLPWPQALPPADVPNHVQPRAVRHCRDGGPGCVRGLARRLRRQWRRFDRRCDHRAVIAYAYLEITRELRRDFERPRRQALVRHRRWMSYVITTFSNRYFHAFRRWRRGKPVPDAWRITFETAAEGDAHAGQDVLLFSNAHVQRDLPFAYAQIGLETRGGRSRKHDHDAVNEVNARVFDRIEKGIAARYDPTMSLFDVPVLPAEEVTALELVKGWREGAWRNAERLLNAEGAAERAEVVASIEASSRVWAELISSGGPPGHRQTRDEWCAARQG